MNFFNEKINVVIIAGASGIGREIARAYLGEDANVFVCDVSDELIAAFKKEFPDIYIEKTDVSEYAQVEAFFRSIGKQIDAIDVLINGAGIAGPTALLHDADPAHWDQTIDVNIKGMFYASKEAIPYIKPPPAFIIAMICLKPGQYNHVFPMIAISTVVPTPRSEIRLLVH